MCHKKITISVALIQNGSSYICLNRDDNHFISLFETTKMVANAEENIVENWSV